MLTQPRTLGFVAGCLSGFIFGAVGARVAMRIAHWQGGFEEASLGGTAVLGIGLTAAGGMVGALMAGRRVHERLRWWVLALITGALVLTAVALEGNWSALFDEGNTIVNLVLFFGSGMGYGAAWWWLMERFGSQAVVGS